MRSIGVNLILIIPKECTQVLAAKPVITNGQKYSCTSTACQGTWGFKHRKLLSPHWTDLNYTNQFKVTICV